MATVTPSALILWLLFVSASAFVPVSSTSNFSLVVSGPTVLQLTPSLIVENSPGLKPGIKVKCERVVVHGWPRIKHLSKFANSLRVKVTCPNPSGCPQFIEVCFHRNVSLGFGMCPQDQWERLTKGLWIKPMSPFDHKILDIRTRASYFGSLEVSLDEELFLYRIIFLVFGILLMSLASWFSKSFVFYYGGAMVVGVILVILMVLFQGMKLLPTGRKSSLAIFLYSCIVGLGSFYIRYVPSLLRALLVEIGLSDDMYNPLSTLLLVFLVIIGAWLGFWVVRKLVITEDGTIDTGVSQFVTWSIRIVAAVMILQSSVDPLLAVGALLGASVVSFVSAHPKAVRRVYRKLSRLNKVNLREPLDRHTSSPVTNSCVPRPYTRAPRTPVRGSTVKSPDKRLSDSDPFFSTFHNTPDRRKVTEDQWKLFTKESTRKALEGLVSSPDFNRWAVKNADRIILAPKKDVSDNWRRWFRWF